MVCSGRRGLYFFLDKKVNQKSRASFSFHTFYHKSKVRVWDLLNPSELHTLTKLSLQKTIKTKKCPSPTAPQYRTFYNYRTLNVWDSSNVNLYYLSKFLIKRCQVFPNRCFCHTEPALSADRWSEAE